MTELPITIEPKFIGDYFSSRGKRWDIYVEADREGEGWNVIAVSDIGDAECVVWDPDFATACRLAQSAVNTKGGEL